VLEGQRQVELGTIVPAYLDPAKAHIFNAEGLAIR
jgi:multiple sugar transport system ATP-binding protein